MQITINSTETVGAQLKRLAKQKGVNLGDICKNVGISNVTFSNMIKRNPSSIETLFDIYIEIERLSAEK